MSTEVPEPHRTFAGGSSFHLLSEIVHDELLDLKGTKFDAAKGVFELSFLRCFHWQGAQQIRTTIFGSEVYKIPVILCKLVFYGVTEYHVTGILDPEGTELLNVYCDSDNLTIKVETTSDASFEMVTTEIKMEYYEIGQRGWAEVTTGLFWESGPRFLRD